MKSFSQRLATRNRLTAMFSIIPSIEVVELIASAGFEAVILDTEHGPYGIEALVPLTLAARAHGTYSIVRVRENNAAMIGAALDAGADAVLVPHITSRAQAEAAVAAARFAPAGSRGANPWVRAAGYGAGGDWFASANDTIAVLVMIEGREGVIAAADILETPGLDGVFLGPVDLSHALGVPGQINHPEVVAKVEEVIGLGNRKSVATAVFAPTAKGAGEWFARGVTLAAVGVDTGHIKDAFTALRKALD